MERAELTIGYADYDRLKRIAADRALADELDRAVVVPEERVPKTVVRMHSRVTYFDEASGERREVVLVYPDEADHAVGNVSVLTPIGAALLGLAEGQSIEWTFPGGDVRRLRVERTVAPAADARRARAAAPQKDATSGANDRSELPLEQLVSAASHRFQLGFARQVIQTVLSQRRFVEDVAFEAAPNGLLMLAPNEEALAEPLRLLREVYGEELRESAPRVRYLVLGSELYEPMMVLRVRIAPRDLTAVLTDLAAREGRILEEDRSRGVCTVRAEVPLRNLLGYGRALARLTSATGQHWTWLDRYVQTGPFGPNAA